MCVKGKRYFHSLLESSSVAFLFNILEFLNEHVLRRVFNHGSFSNLGITLWAPHDQSFFMVNVGSPIGKSFSMEM